MKRRLFQALCLLAVLVAGACTNEKLSQYPGPGPVPGMLTFELTLPAASAVATRANDDGSMTALEENDITHLDVMIFRASDNMFYMRHEVGQGDIQNVDAATGQKKTFYVPVPTELVGGDVYAVLIANAKSSVDAVTLTGRTKQQIMPELTMDVTGIWPVTPIGAFRRFPMWGKSENFDFDATSLETLQVGLLRAVSKIDVGTAYNESTKEFDGLANFEIFRIWLCNSSDLMHVVPDETNYSAAQRKVTAPTLASGSTFTASNEYKQVAAGVPNYGVNSNGKRFVNAIYCAEHAAGSGVDLEYMDNSYLVIEAEYAASGIKTFYRVDFIKTWIDSQSGNLMQEFLPLLRNHQYRVNITKVAGAGFDTFDKAAEARGTNTNLTVVVENSNDEIREIVYNGQYYLGVNNSTIATDMVEKTIDYPIETNYYQIDFSSDVTWITDETPAGTLTTTDKVNGLGALTMNIKFEENDTGAPRTGVFTLTAGMLDMKFDITVVQDEYSRITVWHEDIYFAYRDDQGLPGSQYIEVQCTNDDWRIELTDDPASVVKRIYTDTNGDMTGNAGERTKVYFDFYGQQTTGNNPYTTFDVRIVTTSDGDRAEWNKTLEGGLLIYDKDTDNYFQFPPFENTWVYDDTHWTSSVPPGWKDAATGDALWNATVPYDKLRGWLRCNRKVDPPLVTNSLSMLPINANLAVFTQFLLQPTKLAVGPSWSHSSNPFLSFYSELRDYPHSIRYDSGYNGTIRLTVSSTSASLLTAANGATKWPRA
ncbi:BACON domain-containing protein, partial [uncultured Alistipes sp.]|uniref:BACON domain-containing protein n=1 Tax=uncultured Alistipes sp. TaxID=538949 RepID=UPI0027D97C9D